MIELQREIEIYEAQSSVDDDHVVRLQVAVGHAVAMQEPNALYKIQSKFVVNFLGKQRLSKRHNDEGDDLILEAIQYRNEVPRLSINGQEVTQDRILRRSDALDNEKSPSIIVYDSDLECVFRQELR